TYEPNVMAHSNQAISMQDISDVFSVFHDGGITDFSRKGNDMKMTISCEYLAELISPEFADFHVELKNVQKLEFDPWMNPIERPKRKFKSPEEIFITDLEI